MTRGTIISRTQRIDVKRINDEAIEQALINKRGIDTDAAHRIARIANGSWLKALEAMDTGNENREFHNMFQMLSANYHLRYEQCGVPHQYQSPFC